MEVFFVVVNGEERRCGHFLFLFAKTLIAGLHYYSVDEEALDIHLSY